MKTSRESGITMIENLIATAVLSIGLVGIMAMDAYSVRRSHDALIRTQAILQAQDMADRMHANLQGVAAGDYATAIPTTEPSPNCLSAACTPAQLAAFDKWEWSTITAAILPSGTASISESSGDFAITVSWLEDSESARTVVVDGRAVQEYTETKSFSFGYKPRELAAL